MTHGLSRLAVDELRAIRKRLPHPDAPAWSAPTRCGDWTVADLVAHIVSVAWRQGEAFQRSRLRTMSQPDNLTMDAAPIRLPEQFAAAIDFVESALATTDADPAPLVPLPWAVMPYELAQHVLLIEYGAHQSDLRAALGDEDTLSPGALASIITNLPAVLSAISRTVDRPDMPPVVRLLGETVDATLVMDAGVWSPTDQAPQVTLAGSDHQLGLFALGRLRASVLSDGSPRGVDDWFAGL
jgi:uncharacterized protein (TIGR03083 family)